MDLNFLMEYAVPVVVGICLCIGYIIKTSLDFIPNKYIPSILGILGLIINVLICKGIDANIALAGMFSGLISVGLHQIFKGLIEKDGE